jgi:formylglycine-generating enzyme required for sulfatase activity
VIANASASETKCVAAMIPFGSFCIDRTEVFDPKTHYPLTGLTLDEAAAACRAAGKRLCTGREWESACRGDDGASYPYGSSFRRDPCNVRTSSIARSGTHPACVSASGALDMSGNAAEWVAGGHTRGGSALDRDDGRCSRRKRRSPSTRSLDIGFRCCADRPAAR